MDKLPLDKLPKPWAHCTAFLTTPPSLPQQQGGGFNTTPLKDEVGLQFLTVSSGEHLYRGSIETGPDAKFSRTSGYVVIQPPLGHTKLDATSGSGNKVVSTLPFSLVMNKSILDKKYLCVHSKD